MLVTPAALAKTKTLSLSFATNQKPLIMSQESLATNHEASELAMNQESLAINEPCLHGASLRSISNSNPVIQIEIK